MKFAPGLPRCGRQVEDLGVTSFRDWSQEACAFIHMYIYMSIQMYIMRLSTQICVGIPQAGEREKERYKRDFLARHGDFFFHFFGGLHLFLCAEEDSRRGLSGVRSGPHPGSGFRV